MGQTTRNRDGNLGCLLQGALIAVLILAIVVVALDRLKDKIEPTGIGTDYDHVEAVHEEDDAHDAPEAQETESAHDTDVPVETETPGQDTETTAAETPEPAYDTATTDPEASDFGDYDPVIVAEGEGLFGACAACHNANARGLPGLGKDLVTGEFVGALDDEGLLNFIREGRPVWDAANTTGVNMPARGGNPTLSDEDILKIIAYIRVLRLQAAP